ncbi:MAG: 4Fe-4S binding protein [Clostridia bacterium]|nr:4Fe-4S binding protein [Clostridia bacterium]
MAYTINDDCIACGACVPECPTDAISETDGKFVIDPAACIDCNACRDVCPTDAPQPE